MSLKDPSLYALLTWVLGIQTHLHAGISSQLRALANFSNEFPYDLCEFKLREQVV